MSFIDDFREREYDVLRYLKIMKMFERKTDTRIMHKYDHEFRIFKSSAMLIIYNAIEASAREGIQAIYDELRINNVTFDALRPEFKKIVSKGFKAHSSDSNSHTYQNIAIDIVQNSFKADKLFSGNVDAKKIKEQANNFGFNLNVDFERTQDGRDLLVIKRLRNNLAHGTISFSEATKSYTLEDIERISKHSLAYMHDVLICIQNYIQNEEYLLSNHAA